MPQELSDFIVVAHKEKGQGAFVPFKEHAHGEVRPKLPETSTELFKAETRGNLAHVHREHEGIHLPLDGDLFARGQTVEAFPEAAGERELKHAGEALKRPEVATSVLQVLELPRSLPASGLPGHPGGFRVGEP